MINYRLFADGTGICVTRDEIPVSDTVCLSFSGDGAQTRLGIISNEEKERFFTISDSSCEISSASLTDGENRLTVYGKGKRWKCEPLLMRDGKISPSGIDSSEQILFFKSEYERLCTRLSMCETRLYELETKINQRSLF